MPKFAGAARRLLKGSALEAPARSAWRRLHPGIEELGARYDDLTVEVARRVLTQSSNCIDVGCHKGAILRELVALAPNGRHHAFEPLPDLADGLRREFPSVEVHQIALSDRAGSTTFFRIPEAPALSSLHPRDHPTAEPFEVTVARLDEVIPADFPVQFLKIDVEGFDQSVIRGARGLLLRSHPVVVFEIGHTPAETWQALAEVGMAIYRLEDWLAHRKPFPSCAAFVDAVGPAEFFFLAAPAQ
ncbi:MAG TPA: FkbM family methyltransferase [Mycobacteriales bacterium]|nr:FkbM family methyltransferase [Mycobacteriales bacterium]